MSKLCNLALLVHLVLCVVLGALLLIIPGRLLEAVGWWPIDPIISRMLGAALLAMSWGDWRVWRTAARAETRAWSEVQLAFAGLSALGVLRHLAGSRGWPALVWALFVVLVLYTLLWIRVLFVEHKQRP